jgi:DNA repair photolyase
MPLHSSFTAGKFRSSSFQNLILTQPVARSNFFGMGEDKAKMRELFPILTNHSERATPIAAVAEASLRRLRGIARLATLGDEAGAGHEVEFRTLPVRSLLNHSVSKRGLWFAKSINPYRGCEFGCKYCYARYTHEFMEMKDPLDFERKIYVKENAAWLLRQELKHLRPGEEIALGTATDPYQPIERRARVTRGLLEVLAEQKGLRLGVVTKSILIERDIDLLVRIARQNELVLHITITTPDAKLARILEPRAPRPDLRFRTVRRLRDAGLRAGILCSPLMPGITDDARSLEAMANRAKAADASFFAAQPLFLKPCSKGTFLAFVHENFPQLETSYAKRYSEDAFVSKAYQKRMSDLVAAVTRKHGLNRRFTDALLTRDAGAETAMDRGPEQAELWPDSPPKREAGSIRPQRVMMTS